MSLYLEALRTGAPLPQCAVTPAEKVALHVGYERRLEEATQHARIGALIRAAMAAVDGVVDDMDECGMVALQALETAAAAWDETYSRHA